MVIELSLIILSLGVMAGLVIHKRMEVSRGLRTRLYEARQKSDPVIDGFNRDASRFFSYVSLKNAVLLANFIFVWIVKVFMDASKNIHDSTSAIVARASKKKEDLSRAGAASFYLKKIKEGKDQIESGVLTK